MPTGRSLYRRIADAARDNARQFLRDAERLASAGSRGHASSLAILSVEESAKAVVYYLAAQGVYRIVKRKPNYVTTFREQDLLNHRFKHAIVSNIFSEGLFYAPMLAQVSRLRKQEFTRDEVQQIMQKAVHAHRRLRIELASGGHATKSIKRLFELLESLDSHKNRGLYVDHQRASVSDPQEITRSQMREILDLAMEVFDMASGA